MAIRDILKVPDKRLRDVAQPVASVDEEIRALMDDMLETMYDAAGIGLAATQIGVDKRVVVMDLSEKDGPREAQFLVNPEIVEESEERVSGEEGCLSIPDVYDTVERAARVKVRYLNYEGETVEEWTEGLCSVCVQHEIDHLDGVLFIDYLSRLKRERAVRKVQKLVAERQRLAAD